MKGELSPFLSGYLAAFHGQHEAKKMQWRWECKSCGALTEPKSDHCWRCGIERPVNNTSALRQFCQNCGRHGAIFFPTLANEGIYACSDTCRNLFTVRRVAGGMTVISDSGTYKTRAQVYCWSCGKPLADVRESCKICGKGQFPLKDEAPAIDVHSVSSSTPTTSLVNEFIIGVLGGLALTGAGITGATLDTEAPAFCWGPVILMGVAITLAQVVRWYQNEKSPKGFWATIGKGLVGERMQALGLSDTLYCPICKGKLDGEQWGQRECPNCGSF
ncbi:MAG: hypothetical protein MOB07_19145 [Acidobacteria bacterium]|nr:hypothetical protein [Acidobacteriota bacterium]